MIITIKDLKWSNWFSYGEDNYINFEEPVLQVMGLNGTGKTSIPLILQEVYYGKNSKGKKKASLVNRYLDKVGLEAESNFVDDQDNKYKINLSRKSTLKLQLFKNGEDISSHTTTNTYKTIERIMGLDFKTFSQLIYQSSTDNLDFLTATDANRKKFLITLFNLNKYLSINEKFKSVSSELNTELVGINSKMSTIESWIKKHENADLTEKDIEELPEIDDADVEAMGDIRASLANITETNKKVNINNTYKELLRDLDTSILSYNETVDTESKKSLIKLRDDITKEKIQYETKIKLLDSKKATIKSLGDTCHACKQDIAPELKDSMLDEIEREESSYIDECVAINEDLINIRNDLLAMQEIGIKLKKKADTSSEFSRLNNAIDNSIPSEVLDEAGLRQELLNLSTKITTVKEEIARISKSNSLVSAHNSRIGVILEQLSEHKKDIEELSTKSIDLSDTLNKVEIIKKAFSPSGLLSYKIDFLVRDLEKEINEYLGVLSSGKFQLIFKLENEKLNIEIIDEGMAVSIEELSAGELARINAATLLAIRKLMAAISSTKINILFLDEIMGVLDEGGKEMLIEVLHKEKDLNTLLVSHEYSHPLIPKITIIKENKVSRIENE